MKRKTTSKTPDKLSRSEIFRRYKITDRTLRLLTEKSSLIQLPSESKHGRVLYEIDQDADRVLSMAKVCPYSFSGFRPPSYRFIALGLLISSVDEVLSGLDNRALSCSRISKSILEDLRSKLMAVLPAPLKKRLMAGEEPTKAQEPVFRELLTILGIGMPYDYPEIVEQFYFNDDRTTHFINQLVWTHSTSDTGRAAVITKALGYEVLTAEGVVWYRALFHDHSFMRDKDMKFYLNGLQPSVRKAYEESLEMSAAEFAIKTSVMADHLVEIQHLGRKMAETAMRLIESGNRENREEALRLIQMFVKTNDYIGKIKPKDIAKDTPDYLRDVTIAEYDFDTEFQIPAEFKDDQHTEKSG